MTSLETIATGFASLEAQGLSKLKTIFYNLSIVLKYIHKYTYN
jgi:hypothetical protein